MSGLSRPRMQHRERVEVSRLALTGKEWTSETQSHGWRVVVAGVTLESMQVFCTAIKYHCHRCPRRYWWGIKKLIFGMGAWRELEPLREEESQTHWIAVRNGRKGARAGVGRGNAGRRTRGSGRPGGEGGNHVLTVRTTTGNWLPPHPESIHKQANFAVGWLYMDSRGTSIRITFPLRSIILLFGSNILENVSPVSYRVRQTLNLDRSINCLFRTYQMCCFQLEQLKWASNWDFGTLG